MKKSKLFAILFVSILVLVTSVPALAVTDGELDNGRHPFVGLILFQQGEYMYTCSGTLLSPKVFLTAGHCTDDVVGKVYVWFDDNPLTADGKYLSLAKVDAMGTAKVYPNYNPDAFVLADVGVVLLDKAVKMSEYGVLPQLNQLDTLKTERGTQDVTFTAVGYGMQQSFPAAAGWKDVHDLQRWVAYPKLNQINVPGFTGDFSLLLSNNANTGGTCFGDSGGPNFLWDTNIVAGVTSFGINGNCAGTGGVFRMDRQGPLTWVQSFLEKGK